MRLRMWTPDGQIKFVSARVKRRFVDPHGTLTVRQQRQADRERRRLETRQQLAANARLRKEVGVVRSLDAPGTLSAEAVRQARQRHGEQLSRAAQQALEVHRREQAVLVRLSSRLGGRAGADAEAEAAAEAATGASWQQWVLEAAEEPEHTSLSPTDTAYLERMARSPEAALELETAAEAQLSGESPASGLLQGDRDLAGMDVEHSVAVATQHLSPQTDSRQAYRQRVRLRVETRALRFLHDPQFWSRIRVPGVDPNSMSFLRVHAAHDLSHLCVYWTFRLPLAATQAQGAAGPATNLLDRRRAWRNRGPQILSFSDRVAPRLRKTNPIHPSYVGDGSNAWAVPIPGGEGPLQASGAGTFQDETLRRLGLLKAHFRLEAAQASRVAQALHRLRGWIRSSLVHYGRGIKRAPTITFCYDDTHQQRAFTQLLLDRDQESTLALLDTLEHQVPGLAGAKDQLWDAFARHQAASSPGEAGHVDLLAGWDSSPGPPQPGRTMDAARGTDPGPAADLRDLQTSLDGLQALLGSPDADPAPR